MQFAGHAIIHGVTRLTRIQSLTKAKHTCHDLNSGGAPAAIPGGATNAEPVGTDKRVWSQITHT